jgi:microcystin-dependent protein
MSEMPTHIHVQNAVNIDGTTAIPSATVTLANSKNYEQYRPVSSLTTLHPASITNVGGSQPHENTQPYLTINFIIALIGIFPTQN